MAMVFIDFSDEYEGNNILTLFLQYTFGRRTKILIPNVVIAELVWMLESFYRMTADEIINLYTAT
jgi:predicted nucleic-acid-binding protein